jgi:hypothetical protein
MSQHPQHLVRDLTVYDTDGEPVGIDVTLWRYVNLVTDEATGLPVVAQSYPTHVTVTRTDLADGRIAGASKRLAVSVPVAALGFLADAVASAIEATETAGFDPYGNKPPIDDQD